MTLLDAGVVSRWIAPRAPERMPRLVELVDQLVESEGLCVSHVTVYELRRGMEVLARRNEGHRKRVRLEKLLSRAEILGLDNYGGWDVAARL